MVYRKRMVILLYVLLMTVCIISCSTNYKDECIQNYMKNHEAIFQIADFCETSVYSNIHISLDSRDEKTMYTGLEYKDVEITDPEIINLIKILYEQGYEVILKEEDSIYFQNYSTRNWGCGVAYSMSGTPPHNDFIVEVEALQDPGWYYYYEE